MKMLFRNKAIPWLFAVTILGAGLSRAGAAPLPPLEGRVNVALGKKVLFSPKPTKISGENGGLTDGKISTRADQDLSQDPSAARWSYAGKVNIAVDLGQVHDINEIAIRLQNGSPLYTKNSGRMFPRWVEAYVSNDGEHYQKIAEFFAWKDNSAFKKFDIGEGRGATWIDTLRFKDLNVQGRWVGLRIDTTARTFSDELFVFGKPAANIREISQNPAVSFTVTHPEIYFHKPTIELATNATLPVPLGLLTPDSNPSKVLLDIDIPPGIEIRGGSLGHVPNQIAINSLKPQALPNGWRRYSFDVDKISADRYIARLFMQATSWKDGQQGEIKYRFGDATWQSAELSIPVKAIHVPQAPRLQKIMTGLGYWDSTTGSPAKNWPNELDAFRVIGLNTFSVMAKPLAAEQSKSSLAAIENARKQGFFISSAMYGPFRSMVGDFRKYRKDHGEKAEIFDIFEDGSYSGDLCLSYRGKYYWQEIDRFAHLMAQIKPNFSTEDLELWGSGLENSKKCLRCQADLKGSGLSWDEWKQVKGKEISADLINRTREVLKMEGVSSFDTGFYNVSPEHIYDAGVFNFDKLYPQIITNSQGTTYSSLQPADIIFIGDKARHARQKMAHSNVMPTITPGDAGVFPGDDLQWALLECYANGSRGIWFWSERMWDAESLIAYNKAIRAIAPVEDIIVEGDLVGSSALIKGHGRVSGMKSGARMMLLVADYFGESNGSLKLFLDIPEKSQLRDLLTGEIIGKALAAGTHLITIPLDGKPARLLEVVPQE